MSGQDPELKTAALHSSPGGFHPGWIFRVTRKLFHRLPLVGHIGPALKACFYGVLGRIAPNSGLVRRYQAWQTLQARKRFFREPLAGVGGVFGARETGENDGLDAGAMCTERELPDVIIFPVIDWDFRFQRPQQLAVCLARRGHRVYYLEPEVDTRGQTGALPSVKEERPNLFRVLLPHARPLKVYESVVSGEEAGALRTSIEKMLERVGSRETWSIIDHPGWYPVARFLPNNVLIYDCMDHHAGFGSMDTSMLDLEESCAQRSDLLVVTAQRLFDRFAETLNPVLIRNAADCPYFSKKPDSLKWDDDKSTVGYFGAIAEWFDTDYIVALAEAHPEYRIVLIGDTHGSDLSSLNRFKNIEFPGEVPYEQLTMHLYGFDVCVLPFKVNDLTLATNPVKVYEYLAAGKPVVSVRLPELEPLESHLYLVEDTKSFVVAVEKALAEDDSQSPARKQFTKNHDWEARSTALIQAVKEQATPKVSVVVLTYNNLALTQACLASVLSDSNYSDFELLVADNASTDGTPAYLKQLEQNDSRVRIFLNEKNLGFAAGNNVAAAEAQGKFIVFLNNDTVVTSGWLRDLIRHFNENKKLGLLGPVTNNIGNEARIEIEYKDFDEMKRLARAYCRPRAGKNFTLPVPAFFCVMLPKAVWDKVGPLDECFGLGFFEDDDYAMRVRKEGFEVRCAEDVFIHHHLSATFDKRSEAENASLFEVNRKLYEAKWGAWEPHEYRKK